jgi:glycosyltransferase involved in cell wall biosynthesis
MEQIKVLRIITRMNIGGPAIQAALLSSELDKNNFFSILVTGQVGTYEGDMSYLAVEKGVEPVVVPELCRELNIVNDIISFYKLYKFIKKEKPDVVHTHTAKAGAVGRLAAKATGVPVVIHTFHGHMFHSYFSSFKTILFVLIEMVLARMTDRIIVISERQREQIRQYLHLSNINKLILIPLGFDLEKFIKEDAGNEREGLRGELGIPMDALVVGIIGRLTAIKNHRMFFEVARDIKRRMSRKTVKFLIVGDGELRDELVNLSERLGLQRDVIFTGWIKELKFLYRCLDVVALTSLNEGTPVSLIEALASAKPVVATDVGGVRDVVEDGKSGFVVSVNDVVGFSEAVISLLNDKDKRERFGLYGRDTVKHKYSKHRLLDEIGKLYYKELQRKNLKD